MKIRIMATADEAVELVERLRQVVTIVEVSEPYANRRGDSTLVRVYVEVRL
ncbi:hypothetical protein [Streptomyces sp. STR69]|uniref:hypothetical protein n=1 Tax=Streptomyces sp. STR69 TaxID=1796942 RepID=UPI0021C7A29F|nr:hypothetical protein [Streptomyces sp. STR69]